MIITIIIVCVALVASLIGIIRIAMYGGSVIKPDFRKALERISKGNALSLSLLSNKFWYNSNIVGYYLSLFIWIAVVVAILYFVFA